MNDQNIFVRLSSNVTAFRAQMGAAANAVRQAGSSAMAMSSSAVKAGDAVANSMRRASQEATQLNSGMGKVQGTLAALAATAGVGIGTKLAGDLEQTRVAFTGILGSVEEGNAFVSELQQFAAATPFTFTGLTKSTQQLLALGQTGDEALETLTIVGDAVAAMGGGEEQVQGTLRAMTQMQSMGRMTAQDMNQISQNLPTVQRTAVFDVLAKKLGVTRQEVAKLAQEGGISAEMGIEAIREVMQELPGAAGAMERQSKTLLGVLSSLKDQLQIAAGEGFTPLAEAIRDAVFPMLQQLGGLLKQTMIPLGDALGDVFKALADAFMALAPHLPGIADAFGSLLSAVAPLLPLAAELLSAVLVPLVPVIQAIAGALEFLMNSVPGVQGAIQALAVAFIALKAAAALQAIGGISTILTGVGVAALNAQAGVTKLAVGLRALPAAFGPVGIGIAAVTTAMAIFKPAATAAETTTTNFVEALKLMGDEAIVAGRKLTASNLTKWMRDEGDEAKNLLPLLEAAGVGVDQFATGVLSFDTSQEGTQRMYDVRDAILEAGRAGKLSADSVDILLDALYDMSDDASQSRQIVEGLAKAEKQMGGTGKEAAAGQEELGKALEDLLDPMDAYDEALKAQEAAIDARYDAEDKRREKSQEAAMDALERRQDAESRAFDKQREALAEHLEAQHEIERDALERTQEAEREALSARNEAEKDAIDERADQRERAYDDEARRLKDALDDQQRIERNAFQDRMEELRDLYDEQIEDEKDAWETRKEEIEWMIATTWGAERAGWQQRLVTEEEAHEDRIDTLEEEGDRAVRTETQAFDAAQEAQDRALEDRLQGMKDHLTAVKEAEEAAWADEYRRLDKALGDQHRLQDTALTNRQEAAKKKLADETTDLQTALDDRHARAKKNLEDRQELENTKADERRAAAKTKNELSLTQLQGFLDKQKEKHEALQRDLAIIASRGGAEVLAIIAQMGPGVVAQMAKAGPEAFDAFLEAIRGSIATKGAAQTTADMLAKGWIPLPPGIAGPPTPASAYRGDGAGRGGAVARVRGVLGNFPGARITSTYRTPAENAAVGGSPTSYHLDWYNPAVDIGGPTAVLDDMYRQLVAMGGWRELLWRTKGHYDHIHAAAEGYMTRQAMIASRPILWAEEGPEAYIPLSSSKRARSTSLLSQVAGRFGYGLVAMGNGGISGGGGVVNNVNVQVSARVAAGVDMDYAARAIGERVESAVRGAMGQLHREVTVKAWRN